MTSSIDFVLFRSVEGMDTADGSFALRELQMQWGAQVRVVVGMDWPDALALLPANPASRGLVLQSCWLSLEARCLARLHQALDLGFDVALACDSAHPAPMNAAAYATLRGMERFVDLHPVAVDVAQGDAVGLVELTTVAGLQRRTQGQARVARVQGSWAHDARNYFSAQRDDVLPMVPAFVRRALDVGGGEGGFLAALKTQRPHVHTTLAELTAVASAKARLSVGIDEVFEGRFEFFQGTRAFDCISFLDVLEHMEEPEQALRHARTLLSEHGVVVASIPNVGHWAVVADLLEGRWDWAPLGIHCYSHVRFFTEHTIRRMFARCGFAIEAWNTVMVPCRSDWLHQWQGTTDLMMNRDSLDVYAYVLRARPLDLEAAP